MIVLSLIVVGLGGQKAPLLLDKSRVVASTKGWFEVSKWIADYHWVGPGKVLFARNYPEEPSRVFLLDVKTKAIQEADFSQDFGGFGGDFESLRVSPNGKHVLWAGGKSKDKWYVATFGNEKIPGFARKKSVFTDSLPMPEDYSTLAWSPDSKSVLECMVGAKKEGTTQFWARPLGNLQKETASPVAKGYVDWHATVIGPDLAFANAGIAIGGPRNSLKFVTWKISKPGPTRKEWVVKVPKNRSIAGFQFSHSGKQIVWDLSTHDDKHPGPWDSAGEEVWFSDAKGANWKLVARMPFENRKDDEELAQFGLPKWVPGDKAISFVYKQKLYIFTLPMS